MIKTKITDCRQVLKIEYDELIYCYVLWLVYIDPNDKIYPVFWKDNIDHHKDKDYLLIVAKRKFPQLESRWL
jgi:hypothetical protein